MGNVYSIPAGKTESKGSKWRLILRPVHGRETSVAMPDDVDSKRNAAPHIVRLAPALGTGVIDVGLLDSKRNWLDMGLSAVVVGGQVAFWLDCGKPVSA